MVGKHNDIFEYIEFLLGDEKHYFMKSSFDKVFEDNILFLNKLSDLF